MHAVRYSFINSTSCAGVSSSGCLACLDECPVAAIHQDEDVPAEYHADIAINARCFAERREHARRR